MHDQKQDRREEEEGLQGQFDIQKGQLDGVFQKQIDMRHRAGGDREVEHQEEIGEPEPGADAGRILQRLLDRLEIMRLRGDGGLFRGRVRAAAFRLRGGGVSGEGVASSKERLREEANVAKCDVSEAAYISWRSIIGETDRPLSRIVLRTTAFGGGAQRRHA